MIQITDKSKCCGCGACANICPQKCITMQADQEGFLYPVADKQKCKDCGLCDKICPVINVEKDEIKFPQCYAGYNLDEEALLNSSSGGVFTLLAEYIISRQGAVYGASLVDAYRTCHIRLDNINDIDKLRTSKYMQSEIQEVFKYVKQDLNSGIPVLFTGTTCQIAGLKKYLIREYDNLYTQDLICHGVPSQKVWEKYLKENGFSNTANVNFRDKSAGWENYCVKINETSGTIQEQFNNNIYMKSFLSNCNLRPSCYNCKFKTIHRQADITLADFWGIGNVNKGMCKDKGVSAICIHSKKGKELFDNISSNLKFVQVDLNDIVKYNPSYISSAKPHKNREKFFKNIDNKPLKFLVKKYIEPTILRKLINKSRMVGKKIVDKLSQ